MNEHYHQVCKRSVISASFSMMHPFSVQAQFIANGRKREREREREREMGEMIIWCHQHDENGHDHHYAGDEHQLYRAICVYSCLVNCIKQ